MSDRGGGIFVVVFGIQTFALAFTFVTLARARPVSGEAFAIFLLIAIFGTPALDWAFYLMVQDIRGHLDRTDLDSLGIVIGQSTMALAMSSFMTTAALSLLYWLIDRALAWVRERTGSASREVGDHPRTGPNH